MSNMTSATVLLINGRPVANDAPLRHGQVAEFVVVGQAKYDGPERVFTEEAFCREFRIAPHDLPTFLRSSSVSWRG